MFIWQKEVIFVASEILKKSRKLGVKEGGGAKNLKYKPFLVKSLLVKSLKNL